MKVDNINPNLLKYRLSFQQLHIPLLALAQLYLAYYRGYISRVINNGSGIPRTFVFIVMQFTVMILFFGASIVGKKSFRVNRKTVPFLLLTGLIHVCVSGQLFTRSQGLNGPFTNA
jgi:hypothetical protein